MDVLLAHEGHEANGHCYHLLRDGQTASLCGQVKEEDLFAANPMEVIPQQKAEQHGLDLCSLCHRLCDPP